MIFLGETLYESDSFKDGAGILIIKDSMYVNLLMLNDEENDDIEMVYDKKNDDSEDGIDLMLFFKNNGYDLNELWSEGYNIYYGHVRGAIFEIEINLSLAS